MMPMKTKQTLCMMVAGGLLTFAAHGQALRLEPVTAGVDDISPLLRSMRGQHGTLQRSGNFDRVYRVLDSGGLLSAGGFREGEELYARVSNGVVAVFPRSRYLKSPQGTYAMIPPGTYWYLGATEIVNPWDKEDDSKNAQGGMIVPEREALSMVVDRRVGEVQELNMTPQRLNDFPREEKPEPRPTSIWVNEGYRQVRVGARLDQVLGR